MEQITLIKTRTIKILQRDFSFEYKGTKYRFEHYQKSDNLDYDENCNMYDIYELDTDKLLGTGTNYKVELEREIIEALKQANLYL
jgi:hypothetical protein